MTNLETATTAALNSGLMTGDPEGQPTHYTVNAENVQALVAVVLEAVAGE